MNEKQVQKSGDNSQQLQANTIIFNSGIEEKRAREIFMEMYGVSRRDLTDEAIAIATQRVKEFENDLMPKLRRIEGAMNAFSDPSFQFLLTNAHKTAAATERKMDYSLLSELLIQRIQKGSSNQVRAGISRAVEIVDEISDEALLGLTVAFAIEKYAPVTGNISEGLDVLNNLFEKIYYATLPVNTEWLEHLEILNAVRLSSFVSLKKLEEYYSDKLNGYCVTGIKHNSENYLKVIEIMKELVIPRDILVSNDLNKEYVRLNIVDESSIEELSLIVPSFDGTGIFINRNFSEEQKQALHEIFKMYDEDENLKQEIKNKFSEELKKRPYLNKIREWWNEITISFNITAVGRVLANSNAKRCDESLPSMD